MGFDQSTGKYADRMLNPGGWPDIDEVEFLHRAEALSSILQQLARNLESWLGEHTEISSGAIWSGNAAVAGSTAIDNDGRKMTEQQANILRTMTWYSQVFSQILETKISIFNRVVQTESQIAALETNSMNPETRSKKN